MQRRSGLLLVLAVWALSTTVLLMCLTMLKNSLAEETEDQLHGDLEQVIEEIGGWQQDMADEHLLIELPDHDWSSFNEFRRAYLRQIDEELDEVESGTGQDLLHARSAILENDANRHTRSIHQLTRLMLEESPEDYHDRIERLIEDYREEFDLPDDEPDLTLTVDGVVSWIEEHEEEYMEQDICAALLNQDGHLLTGNLEPPFPVGEGVIELERIPDEEGHSIICQALSHELEDSGWLIFGGERPEFNHLISTIQPLAISAMAIIGLVATTIVILMGRNNRRRLAEINTVCERAKQGDYTQRINQTGNDDLGRLAAHINAMLGQTEALMESLRSVSTNIAHDLRTPLTRLRGQIDLLAQANNPDESVVAAVQAEADQLLDTFSALLRIAQVDSGSPKSGFRDFDLTQLVRDVAELYEPAFEEQDIQFQLQAPSGMTLLHGDLDLWMQSFANLMDNGLKYVPAGRMVSLSLENQSDAYRIVVRDTGNGVPDLELDKVLDRFYRLPKHRGKRGNGLGLSLVAAVCKLHQANLTLRNDNGLVVEILIPADSSKEPKTSINVFSKDPTG